MKLHTAQSVEPDPEVAVQQVYDALVAGLGGAPSWAIMTHGADLSGPEISAAWSGLDRHGALHRLSTCQGSMGDFGFQSSTSVSVLGIRDEGGAFTSVCEAVSEDADADILTAIERLHDESSRPGEAPDVIFVTTSPGLEEAVLSSIRSEFGESVLVIGGTAADDAIEGQWNLGDARNSVSRGVVLSALHTSSPVSAAFSSGYVPTGTVGTVTASEGRTIHSIDGKPATQVYNEWTGGALDEVLGGGGGMILAESSLLPIGRKLGLGDDEDIYLLSHPSNADSNGPLDLFAEFEVGDEVELMTGSIDSLIQRGARVVEESLRELHELDAAGTLVVYCAGCRLTVGERMPEVPAAIQESLSAPFLGIFTFGEQGSVGGRTSRHGNLMISALTFHG